MSLLVFIPFAWWLKWQTEILPKLFIFYFQRQIPSQVWYLCFFPSKVLDKPVEIATRTHCYLQLPSSASPGRPLFLPAGGGGKWKYLDFELKIQVYNEWVRVYFVAEWIIKPGLSKYIHNTDLRLFKGSIGLCQQIE